ncbi:MAG: hypothetical protein Tsb0020_01660 [Haliangiales bacterium]
MSLASIPVDLFNPGQVFGCLGFMEAAIELCGSARATYDWSDPRQSRFHLDVPGDANGFETVLRFLAEATVSSQAPFSEPDLATEKWNVDTVRPDPAPASGRYRFPIAVPSSPATLPAVLRTSAHAISLYHWGDTTQRDNVKFWAGSGGYPGAAFLRDALDLIRARLLDCADDPFAVSASQPSSFRFDWRRDYIPMDVGFSLNAHSHIVPLGYPIVEIMAAIGLTHARPLRPKRQNKLHYRYAVIGRADAACPTEESLLPPALLRATLGGLVKMPFATRRFEMSLGWPGQENQARCITNVIEETVK